VSSSPEISRSFIPRTREMRILVSKARTNSDGLLNQCRILWVELCPYRLGTAAAFVGDFDGDKV
jgi:hypothetical protein